MFSSSSSSFNDDPINCIPLMNSFKCKQFPQCNSQREIYGKVNFQGKFNSPKNDINEFANKGMINSIDKRQSNFESDGNEYSKEDSGKISKLFQYKLINSNLLKKYLSNSNKLFVQYNYFDGKLISKHLEDEGINIEFFDKKNNKNIIKKIKGNLNFTYQNLCESKISISSKSPPRNKKNDQDLRKKIKEKEMQKKYIRKKDNEDSIQVKLIKEKKYNPKEQNEFETKKDENFQICLNHFKEKESVYSFSSKKFLDNQSFTTATNMSKTQNFYPNFNSLVNKNCSMIHPFYNGQIFPTTFPQIQPVIPIMNGFSITTNIFPMGISNVYTPFPIQNLQSLQNIHLKSQSPLKINQKDTSFVNFKSKKQKINFDKLRLDLSIFPSENKIKNNDQTKESITSNKDKIDSEPSCTKLNNISINYSKNENNNDTFIGRKDQEWQSLHSISKVKETFETQTLKAKMNNESELRLQKKGGELVQLTLGNFETSPKSFKIPKRLKKNANGKKGQNVFNKKKELSKEKQLDSKSSELIYKYKRQIHSPSPKTTNKNIHKLFIKEEDQKQESTIFNLSDNHKQKKNVIQENSKFSDENPIISPKEFEIKRVARQANLKEQRNKMQKYGEKIRFQLRHSKL